jgi:hypothetical protein
MPLNDSKYVEKLDNLDKSVRLCRVFLPVRISRSSESTIEVNIHDCFGKNIHIESIHNIC